ncbi:hypothetical protein CASFOL_028465 [Castilleja foliolosa]|uniref:Uncharacterized protein n=1 Tax=Castilleja foliolosa TaxID=1961234 RepID=A0ABD3CC38_9LAMI
MNSTDGIINGRSPVNYAKPPGEVAIFLVLAIVLCHKPDVLISIVPKLRENLKYQRQNKLPLLALRACQGDLALNDEAVYPTLKVVTLAGSPGSTTMKQFHQRYRPQL